MKCKSIISFILILFTAIALTSCYTSEDQKRLQDECKSLKTQRDYLRHDIDMYSQNIYNLKQQVSDLNKERVALQSGRELKYIVKFKIKQGTFTLDISEHIKNAMNSIEIEIPVNKDFYNHLSIGQDITDSFKWGSLVVNGDFSTLHMKVIDKRIE